MSPNEIAQLKAKLEEAQRLRQGLRSGFLPPIKTPEVSLDMTEAAAELILRSAGEDLAREGLQRTPQRFAKAMRELLGGYALGLADAVGAGVFEAEGKGLVSVKSVEFYSLCEHHMLPFFGTASVAYYPSRKILGLSKVPRIVDLFARRFQVQERLTREIAEAIHVSIAPRAIVVRMTGSHLCMVMRGVKKQESETTTEFVIGLENLSELEKSRLFQSLI
jgi:GTP cyclohydrolase I